MLLLRRPLTSPLYCEPSDSRAVQTLIFLYREEFGVTNNQASTYTTWYNAVISSGLTGDLIWQAGSHFSDGDSPNDGFAVYPDGAAYPVVKQFAATLKSRG